VPVVVVVMTANLWQRLVEQLARLLGKPNDFTVLNLLAPEF
jgi:hypothetical protein